MENDLNKVRKRVIELSKEEEKIDQNLKRINSFIEKTLTESNSKNNDKQSQQNLKKINNQKFLSQSSQLINRLNGKNKSYKRIFDVIAISLLLIAIILLYWEHIRIYFTYFLRLLVVLGSSFYDFTSFYQNTCLVSNPYFKKESLIDKKTCKLACGKKTKTSFLSKYDESNLTSDTFYKLVYESNVPIVEKSEINQWPIMNHTLKSISNLYLENPEILNDENICFFDSNILNTNPDQSIYDIFSYMSTKEDLNNFSVMWENCNKMSPKILKKLIKRPKFLSNNFEIVTQNWVFSFKNETNDFLTIPASTKLNLFCQISGEVKARLIPVKDCEQYCLPQRVLLKKGQMLIFTDLWSMEFKPSSASSQEETTSILMLAH